MANISFTGIVFDGFQPVDHIDDLQDGADVIVTLDLLQESFEALSEKAGRIAVAVDGDTNYRHLSAYTDRLSLVRVTFPVFADGRGFSLAVRLRKDLGFKGALIADGHVLPDQGQYLLRAGFDGAVVPDKRQAAFEKQLSRYQAFYQTTFNGDQSVAHQRHSTASKVEAA